MTNKTVHNQDPVERFKEIFTRFRALQEQESAGVAADARAIDAIATEIRTLVAREIEPILNRNAGEAFPSIEAKREAVGALDTLLDHLGLGVRCSDTGDIGRMTVKNYARPHDGAFVIEIKEKVSVVGYSRNFPEISLALAPPHKHRGPSPRGR